MALPERITYFAETDYRNRKLKFGIKEADRARHMYVIGKTGMGKSTLLENLAIQDIVSGNGIGFIDPHGSSAEELLSYVPEHRVKDVIYFAPFDQEYPIAFNVMEDIGKDQRPLVASGLLGSFKKVWVDAWSPRMEYLLNNAILALLEYPDSTLLGVNRMFADKNYRTQVVDNAKDPSVKSFWNEEFAKYNERYATEAAAAIQNKVGQFAANPLIRNMMGQPKSSFNIREVMDGKKIFIANLSKGRIGEGNASLIGGMLITKLYLAAMSRADISSEGLRGVPPFYLYVDEFQSFANESFADILSEARKYRLALTIAHQYIEQMSDEVRAAVFGNVGTMMSFRVGSYDAEVLEKEFAPAFTAEDLVNLGFAQIYLKLMIDGIGSSPFSAKTLPRPEKPARSFREEVIASSRAQFASPRLDIEEKINKWHAPIELPRSADRAPRKDGPQDGMRSTGASAGSAPRFSSPPRPQSPGGMPSGRPFQPQTPRTFTAPRPYADKPDRPAPLEFVEKKASEKIIEKTVERIVETTVSMTEEVTPPPATFPAAEKPQVLPAPPVVPPAPAPVVEKNQAPIVPPAAPPRSASLSQLVHKDKNPSAKNISSLKEALAMAMKNHETKKSEEKSEKTSPDPEVQKAAPAPAAPVQPVVQQAKEAKTEGTHAEKPRHSGPEEVPEDVLRKMLGD